MRRLLRRVLFPVAAAALAATLFGCAKDDGDVTNPNPERFQPKGIVQGLLVDSVTQQPIVGAVVDMGVGTATTNERGQFVIRDVPVNQDVDNDNTDDGYNVTVDLRGVSSPVDMKAATTTTKYPDFKYEWVQLSFSSLDDTEGSNPGGGSGSNHDTPVDNLVANMAVSVGKLSTSVKGCVIVEATNQLVANADGYTVRLRAYGSDNSATGANGRVLATTNVVDGQYTFSNLEAVESFWVEAVNAAGTMGGGQSFSTSVDGTTTDLTCTTGSCSALLVSSNDDCAPFLLSTSVKDNEDLAPKADQTVVFTFSEAIKATPYAAAVTPSGAANGGLYEDVLVTFEGGKFGDRAGNIAHTIAWTAANELTVTIAQTAVSSKYKVVLRETALVTLVDAAGNHLTAGREGQSYVQMAASSGPEVTVTVNFTTNGGQDAATVTDLELTNEKVDYDTDTANLDWTPAVGAKKYNLYCAESQVWGADANAHQFVLINDNFDITSTSINVDFDDDLLEGKTIALERECYIVGVNSDGVEGEKSNQVTLRDETAPDISDVSVGDEGFAMPAAGASDTFEVTVWFSEPMDEALAEDPANYAIANDATAPATDAKPTVTSAVYNVGGEYVTLTVEVANDAGGTKTYTGDWTLTVSDVTDVAGNVIDADPVENGVLAGFPVLNLTTATPVGYNFNATVTVDWLPVSQNDDHYVITVFETNLTTGDESEAWSTTILNGATTYSQVFNGNNLVDVDAGGFLYTPVRYDAMLETYDVDGNLIARSNRVSISDVVKPKVDGLVVTTPFALPAAAAGKTGTFTLDGSMTLTFDEPMRAVQAEAVGNYLIGTALATLPSGQVAPTVKSVEFTPPSTVVVKLQATKAAAGDTLYADWNLKVVGQLDIAGNSIDDTADEWAPTSVFPTRTPAVTANPF